MRSARSTLIRLTADLLLRADGAVACRGGLMARLIPLTLTTRFLIVAGKDGSFLEWRSSDGLFIMASLFGLRAIRSFNSASAICA